MRSAHSALERCQAHRNKNEEFHHYLSKKSEQKATSDQVKFIRNERSRQNQIFIFILILLLQTFFFVLILTSKNGKICSIADTFSPIFLVLFRQNPTFTNNQAIWSLVNDESDHGEMCRLQ